MKTPIYLAAAAILASGGVPTAGAAAVVDNAVLSAAKCVWTLHVTS